MKKILTLLSSALLATGAWAQNTHEGHEYVNLGLPSGTMWATCNIGADAPEAAGYYYAWGETETHYSAGGNTDKPTWKEGYSAGYNWSTYKWCKGSDNTLTKYNRQSKASDYGYKGFYDDKFTLEKADDVASKLWGGSWVVPTHAQQDELCNECDWEWTSINGVNGYKVKSRVNSNFIFLPAAGFRWNTKLYDVGDNGEYWSSSLNESFPNNAQYLDISLSNVSSLNGASRSFGYSIRPVCVPPAPIAQIGETTYTDVDKFREAFYAIGGTATVKLLGDITLSENGWFYNDKSTADITLDLNGHNITGSVSNNAIIYIEDCKLTISGEGVVENKGEAGDVVGNEGYCEINGGTYICVDDICYFSEGTMIINGGKFNASELYYKFNFYTKPTVKGGLFSMDPSDGVAEGYEVVENDDEETKAEYPYKVVEAKATGVRNRADIDHLGAFNFKTIENGKVVIIRGDKKYDLSGREL
ncbi:MAG: hypothetical protein MJZ01_04890 [Bacteroidales bacterium]|nr:hypothetical protein [Bacteroidales bacterium]